MHIEFRGGITRLYHTGRGPTKLASLWELLVVPNDSSQMHTDWSMIMNAVRSDDLAASDALEQLARRYWPAVYAYIRGTGRDVHEAADLTQGFICDVVIGRQLFHTADPERGRFRSLLRRSLQNYLNDAYRRASKTPSTSQANQDLSFISRDEIASLTDNVEYSADEAFDAQWTRLLVNAVLDRVRQACERDGLEPHWVIFERRIARPILTGEPPAPYEALIEQFDLRDASQAANMMVTVKRRFASELYTEVMRTVSDPLLADGELTCLRKALENAL